MSNKCCVYGCTYNNTRKYRWLWEYVNSNFWISHLLIHYGMGYTCCVFGCFLTKKIHNYAEHYRFQQCYHDPNCSIHSSSKWLIHTLVRWVIFRYRFGIFCIHSFLNDSDFGNVTLTSFPFILS